VACWPGTGDRYRTFRSAASRDRYGAGVVVGDGAGQSAGCVGGYGASYGPADVLSLSREDVLSSLLEVRLCSFSHNGESACCLRIAATCLVPLPQGSGTTPVVGLAPLL
jgi:hypothetical protein